MVITPYTAQRDQIKEDFGDHGIGFPVHTVDGCQGKDARIVVVSFVVTSSMGLGSIRWIIEQHRLCVALSRASDELHLIGDLAGVRDIAAGTQDSENKEFVERALRHYF